MSFGAAEGEPFMRISASSRITRRARTFLQEAARGKQPTVETFAWIMEGLREPGEPEPSCRTRALRTTHGAAAYQLQSLKLAGVTGVTAQEGTLGAIPDTDCSLA